MTLMREAFRKASAWIESRGFTAVSGIIKVRDGVGKDVGKACSLLKTGISSQFLRLGVIWKMLVADPCLIPRKYDASCFLARTRYEACSGFAEEGIGAIRVAWD